LKKKKELIDAEVRSAGIKAGTNLEGSFYKCK
jgi:hypothetical protein